MCLASFDILFWLWNKLSVISIYLNFDSGYNFFASLSLDPPTRSTSCNYLPSFNIC